MHVPSALLYLFSSSVIMYTNKQVMSAYNLHPTYIMVSQAVVLLMYLFLCRREKISLHASKGLFSIAILNTSNVFFGLLGSTHMSVAVFTALRRASLGLILVGEIVYLGQKKSEAVIGTVVMMMMAIALVAIDDSSATFNGYSFIMMNNILTAASALVSKSVLNSSTTKETVMVITNGSTVVFGMLMSMGHEWEYTVPGVLLWLASAILGALIQFSSTWSVQKNGPLTQSVLGSSKNVIMSLLSCMHIIDNDYVFTWINFLALQITAIASFLYVWVSI